MNLVLASSSPRRIELLKFLGLPFTVRPSDWEETFDPAWKPEKVVLELSKTKAQDVAAKLNGAGENLVIGGDTIVVLDNHILGKPKSEDEACDMLRRLSGRDHIVYTGVTVLSHPSGGMKQGFERTEVTFRALSDDEIRAYVATKEPMDKAGAYALQGTGASIVARVNGCYSNVIGFPMPLVTRLLRECGVTILGSP